MSGEMVGLLFAFGVDADLAVASMLVYRAVAIWLPVPFGPLAGPRAADDRARARRRHAVAQVPFLTVRADGAV